ncbi:hypothetical protein CYMTET_10180 [Cymbomonas tetramitiformis]|uniref:Uncharacterized protein n=1 Tax=Cymbomonas tetramitiformis TaxID=36881 RepID=A0AAE0GQ95_9CHLO|nr:hypothetical protein CYMTET_10180 [Cymbomonas tetramitiformis]
MACNDQGRSKEDCDASSPPQDPAPMQALLAQQTALISTMTQQMTQQMKDLNARVEAAEEASATASRPGRGIPSKRGRGGGTGCGGGGTAAAAVHASRRRESFSMRPATLETEIATDVLPAQWQAPRRPLQANKLVEAVKLPFTEEQVHAGAGGAVNDFVLAVWLEELDTQKVKAVMTTHKAEAVLRVRARSGTATERVVGDLGLGQTTLSKRNELGILRPSGCLATGTHSAGKGAEQKGGVTCSWREQRGDAEAQQRRENEAG